MDSRKSLDVRLVTLLKCAVLRVVGFKPSQMQVRSYLATVNDPTQKDPEELKRGFVKFIQEGHSCHLDQGDIIRQTFLAFDIKGQGYVTSAELVQVFKQVMPRMRSDTVEELFREIDCDGDGCVTFREFEQVLKFIPA